LKRTFPNYKLHSPPQILPWGINYPLSPSSAHIGNDGERQQWQQKWPEIETSTAATQQQWAGGTDRNQLKEAAKESAGGGGGGNGDSDGESGGDGELGQTVVERPPIVVDQFTLMLVFKYWGHVPHVHF